MNSPWFDGAAEILTYQLDELIATKLCALYHRNKGRDLFDVWLANRDDLIDPDHTLEIFKDYCDKTNNSMSRAQFEKNMHEKHDRPDFQNDILPLLAPDTNWDYEEAFHAIHENFISHLPGSPWKGLEK